jgi:DNA polymerase
MSAPEHPDPAAWRDAVQRGEASLDDAALAARGCRACRLWLRGTQTVFGSGPKRHVRVVFIGEQPGDREDLDGKPFVGPAGRLLDTALEAAEIDRRTAYLTNVVKHFSWEHRGKRRIHKKPKADEIRAWIEMQRFISDLSVAARVLREIGTGTRERIGRRAIAARRR